MTDETQDGPQALPLSELPHNKDAFIESYMGYVITVARNMATNRPEMCDDYEGEALYTLCRVVTLLCNSPQLCGLVKSPTTYFASAVRRAIKQTHAYELEDVTSLDHDVAMEGFDTALQDIAGLCESDEERQYVLLSSAGHTDREIATELGLTDRSVPQRIRSKLQERYELSC